MNKNETADYFVVILIKFLNITTFCMLCFNMRVHVECANCFASFDAISPRFDSLGP
jgi:hypothetical protein